jgi:hypothetical protein
MDFREENPDFKGLTKFLCRVSGVRMSILKMPGASGDRKKYADIGMWMILASSLATASFSYAAWTVFKSIPLTIFAGVFGAIMTLTTDRFMVGEIRKEEKMIWNQWGLILVRIMLSVMISTVVAVPLEISIFQGRIDTYLSEVNQAKAMKLDEELKLQFPDIQILTDRNQTLEAQLKQAREQKDLAVEESILEGSGSKGSGRTGKAGMGEMFKLRQQAAKQLGDRYDDLKEKTEQENIQNNEKIAEFKTQAQARRLAAKKVTEDSNTLPVQMEALEEISKISPVIKNASLALTLAIIAIEISPVICKALSKRGNYDAILERIEYAAISLEDKRRASDSELTDKQLANQRKKEDKWLEHDYELFVTAEDTAHENLKSEILEIHAKAIGTNEWKAAHDAAISKYVKSISRQLSEYACVFQLSDREFNKFIRPELVKMAKEHARTVGKREFAYRDVHNSKESLLKRLEDKVKEMTQRWRK